MSSQPPDSGLPGGAWPPPPPPSLPQVGAVQSSAFGTGSPPVPGHPLFPLHVDSSQRPPPAPPPPRRHRGMFWVAVLAALAALVGGTVVAVTAYTGASTPGAVVQTYFHALGRGDAPAALALGDLPDGPRTFLTSDVLRAGLKIAKLTSVSVLSTSQQGDTAKVTIQYQLRFPTKTVVVNDTVSLRKHSDGWRLAATAVATNLDPVVAARRLVLAGAAVPSGTVLLFPGALPLAADTPNLDVGLPVVHLQGVVPRNIRPTVSAAGRQAVADAVAGAVQKCLDGKVIQPCPTINDDRAVPGSIRGTLPSDVASHLDITLAPGPSGLIEISGTVDVHGRYQRLDFNNLPFTHSGPLALNVRAQAYATDPSKLQWDTPS